MRSARYRVYGISRLLKTLQDLGTFWQGCRYEQGRCYAQQYGIGGRAAVCISGLKGVSGTLGGGKFGGGAIGANNASGRCPCIVEGVF